MRTSHIKLLGFAGARPGEQWNKAVRTTTVTLPAWAAAVKESRAAKISPWALLRLRHWGTWGTAQPRANSASAQANGMFQCSVSHLSFRCEPKPCNKVEHNLCIKIHIWANLHFGFRSGMVFIQRVQSFLNKQTQALISPLPVAQRSQREPCWSTENKPNQAGETTQIGDMKASKLRVLCCRPPGY